MELEVRDATIRARDRADNVVEIATVGWDQPAPPLAVPFAVDATISGRARRLSLDTPNLTVGPTDRDGQVLDRAQLDANETIEFDDPGPGGVLVWSTGRINTWIRFRGPAVVEKEGDRDVSVSFPHPTAVTLAFQGSAAVPSHTVTVPRTPRGVATALSQFPASYTETTPARTSSLSRGHPPRIVFGEETRVPEQVSEAVGESGIELHLPSTLEALLPAASLATYLGAEVSIDPERPPTLSIPDRDVRRTLSPVPEFQYDAAATLRRVFSLDMLVRWLTKSELDWFEADALSVLDLDPDRCADRTLGERVATYLEVDFPRAASIFPEWTANVYADPTYESVPALPYLTRHLTQVYLPDASPDRDRRATGPMTRIDGGNGESADVAWDRRRVQRLHDREKRDRAHGPRPRVRGPYVGWLGEDPLDGAYQVTLPALRHREKYLGEHEEITVALVCADPDRTDERDRLLALYDVETPDVEVTTYDRPTRARVTDLLAEGTDLLHYVGDCRDGLACGDGVLAPAEFPESSVRTFFLDGSRSRRTGLELLEAGSVAGAVWDGDPGPVADRLRRDFLRGLLGGLTADVAGRYARHFSGGPLGVVGDGLHELVVYGALDVFPMEVDPVGGGEFRVRIPPGTRTSEARSADSVWSGGISAATSST